MSSARNQFVRDDREKGFTTYFQGANRDETSNANKNLQEQRSSRRSKGWGAPASTILGRKIQPDKNNVDSKASTSTVLNDPPVNDKSRIESPNTSNSLNLQLNPAPVVSATTEFKIRLRFTTTWTKAKYLSLHRIRLSLLQFLPTTSTSTSTDMTTNQWIDVDLMDTGHVHVAILSDLMLLPPSHDSNKSIHKLLSTLANTSRISHSFSMNESENEVNDWICPIASYIGTSIELNISGDLSPKYIHSLDSLSSPCQMILSLWNGSIHELKAISPVKDFAFYCNSVCIYSGELPLNTTTAIATTVTSQSTNIFNMSDTRDPSITIPFTLLAPSSTSSTQISSARPSSAQLNSPQLVPNDTTTTTTTTTTTSINTSSSSSIVPIIKSTSESSMSKKNLYINTNTSIDKLYLGSSNNDTSNSNSESITSKIMTSSSFHQLTNDNNNKDSILKPTIISNDPDTTTHTRTSQSMGDIHESLNVQKSWLADLRSSSSNLQVSSRKFDTEDISGSNTVQTIQSVRMSSRRNSLSNNMSVMIDSSGSTGNNAASSSSYSMKPTSNTPQTNAVQNTVTTIESSNNSEANMMMQAMVSGLSNLLSTNTSSRPSSSSRRRRSVEDIMADKNTTMSAPTTIHQTPSIISENTLLTHAIVLDHNRVSSSSSSRRINDASITAGSNTTNASLSTSTHTTAVIPILSMSDLQQPSTQYTKDQVGSSRKNATSSTDVSFTERLKSTNEKNTIRKNISQKNATITQESSSSSSSVAKNTANTILDNNTVKKSSKSSTKKSNRIYNSEDDNNDHTVHDYNNDTSLPINNDDEYIENQDNSSNSNNMTNLDMNNNIAGYSNYTSFSSLNGAAVSSGSGLPLPLLPEEEKKKKRLDRQQKMNQVQEAVLSTLAVISDVVNANNNRLNNQSSNNNNGSNHNLLNENNNNNILCSSNRHGESFHSLSDTQLNDEENSTSIKEMKVGSAAQRYSSYQNEVSSPNNVKSFTAAPHSKDPYQSADQSHTMATIQSQQQSSSSTNVYDSTIYGMPQGRVIHIEIYSTWGDEFYVGLNGIELFNNQGQLLWIHYGIDSIKLLYPSHPSDHYPLDNSLDKPLDLNSSLSTAGYTYDPRHISNLIDGKNYTRDDHHVWVTSFHANTTTSTSKSIKAITELTSGNFQSGKAPIAIIEIKLVSTMILSMIRIFNFNKSRTHSYRGVKECKIYLDHILLYDDEIPQASGILSSLPTVSHDIFLTEDPEILYAIYEYDQSAGYHTNDDEEEDDALNHTNTTSTTYSISPHNTLSPIHVLTGHDSNMASHIPIKRPPTGDSSQAGPTCIYHEQTRSIENVTHIHSPLHQFVSQVSPKGSSSTNMKSTSISFFPDNTLSPTNNNTATTITSTTASVLNAMVNSLTLSPKYRPVAPYSKLYGIEEEAINTDSNYTYTSLTNTGVGASIQKNTVPQSLSNTYITSNRNSDTTDNINRDSLSLSTTFSPLTLKTSQHISSLHNKSTYATTNTTISNSLGTSASSAMTAQTDPNKIITTTCSSDINPPITIDTWKDIFIGQKIRIELLSTWGDDQYIGLTGLQVLHATTTTSTTNSTSSNATRQYTTTTTTSNINIHIEKVSITPTHIDAEPRDLSSIGYYDDPRVLTNLISPTCMNNTTCEKYMWLAPYTKGCTHEIIISLPKVSKLVGLKLWNYNKFSPYNEELLKGVRMIRCFLDDKFIGYSEVRIAPGYDSIDFSQQILFRDMLLPNNLIYSPFYTNITHTIHSVKKDSNHKSNSRNMCPNGMLWCFTLYENWNDAYYIGLDSIEFYDYIGNKIDILSIGGTIMALPHSLQVLSITDSSYTSTSICTSKSTQSKDNQIDNTRDPRTPRQLFVSSQSSMNLSPNSQKPHLNSSSSGFYMGHSWLAPLSRCMTETERLHSGGPQTSTYTSTFTTQPSTAKSVDLLRHPVDNMLYMMCPYPISVAYIKIYNYSKTLSRGVKELSIAVDHKMIYMGQLKTADAEMIHPTTGIYDKTLEHRVGQIILLTDDPSVISSCSIIGTQQINATNMISDQDVLCINERKIMIKSKTWNETPNSASEGIHIDLNRRPSTSIIN